MYIHDYVGIIDGGKRRQQKAISELNIRFNPDYEFYEEWPEFGMGQAFNFTTLDDLHQHVERLADNLDEAYKFVKNMMEDLHR